MILYLEIIIQLQLLAHALEIIYITENVFSNRPSKQLYLGIINMGKYTINQNKH